MTVSTKITYTAGQWVQTAYRKLGLLATGAVPNDGMLTEGMLALNLMVLGWQADGPNLYRQTQLALNIPARAGWPDNVYTIPLPNPADGNMVVLAVEEARWVVSPSPNLFERPLGIFTYGDYMSLPNKQSASQSGPSAIMFDRQIGASNLYFFPLPAVSGQCRLTVARPANLAMAVGDPIDVPLEWYEDGTYTLADRLMDNHGVAAADQITAQRVTDRAKAFNDKLLNFDRPASIMIRPWGRKGRRRYWRG